MEMYLILKLDEETLTHFPVKMSTTEIHFDADVPDEQLQEYRQIVVRGDAFDLKTLENILFPTESAVIRRYLDKLEELEQQKVREIFNLTDDFGRTVSDHKSGSEGT